VALAGLVPLPIRLPLAAVRRAALFLPVSHLTLPSASLA
jgi:hypothetical protein